MHLSTILISLMAILSLTVHTETIQILCLHVISSVLKIQTWRVTV